MFKYDSAYWNNAKFIKTDMKPYADFDNSPWADDEEKAKFQFSDVSCDDGMPMFVKDFSLDNPSCVKLAFAALGCIDIFVNGKRVGNDEMKPGWTNYNKRTLYYEYDITEYTVNGTNRILLIGAPGWYQGRISGGYYGAHMPAVMACVTADGAKVVSTDESWMALCGGQIRTADIWDGEYRDARFDSYEVISTPAYDVSGWKAAEICDYFEGEVTPFIGPTVRVRDGLGFGAEKMTVYENTKDNGTKFGEIDIISEPQTLPVTLKAGQKLVVDITQEVVGWVNLKLKGAEGAKVKVRYAEFLNDSGDIERGNDGPKGSVYTVNLRSAKGKSHYVLSGKGEEAYRPTFTFFGFRFVEISADADVELLDFKAEVVGSDTKEIGFMETSDELVNKLISNVIWGQRSNYLSIPTDCPQRDERLGWTGDAQAFSVTAAYNADVSGFFRKWMQDMRDSQIDGAYGDIAPRVSYCSADNATAWGDAGVIIPYNLYKLYGDKEFLAEHYPSMEDYIANLIEKYGFEGPIPRYGDWLSYDYCKNEYLASAFLVHDLDMMIFMSEELGKPDRAEHYRALRKEAHKYFEDTFMKDGELIDDTQTDYVIAIAFDLISGDYLKKATARLVEKIKENGNRLTTGFVGTYNLCPALSKMGEDNLAYTLLMQRNEPSWLYSVDQGATTIWERWNSYTIENGFGDVGMNSFNHYAYGSVQEWMYRYMAGIETDGVGFKNILLQPRVDTRTAEELPEGQQRMKWIRTSYNSVAGLIESSWSNEENFVYECTVPEGSSAKLLLPVFADKVIINGVEHNMDEFEKENNCAVITLGAGSYVFEEV
ncbi:MAG: family 78 glycoside hydrolase catalytic domain [Clostridia bacterium]|nr:family 78 glycoside hydrolase catalytic domain [Clostridia bacterium]